ncbi:MULTISPECIES: aldose epimerase family protein [unclassified Croceitalea]|uniref:aldose epimerase family protein n=1 Tax=unclassified Croceitalea TaxID=2632280 RepID=UPI0030DAAC52
MEKIINLKHKNQIVKIDAGELVGYNVNGHEFIHQKGSPGWSSSDTEMFPIIGPVSESRFQVETPRGNAIQDQHGHLRQMEYNLVSSDTISAIYNKVYEAGTPIKNSKFPKKSTEEWMNWPYSFEFEKSFKLDDDGLEIQFVISGDKEMPFMLGYHPAFKLYTDKPTVDTGSKQISLLEVLAVGSRALQVSDCESITLKDEKELTIKTEGFGHFMCWTEVANMVCIEPISFYPYAVSQENLHAGFQLLEDKVSFKVFLLPKM